MLFVFLLPLMLVNKDYHKHFRPKTSRRKAEEKEKKRKLHYSIKNF